MKKFLKTFLFFTQLMTYSVMICSAYNQALIELLYNEPSLYQILFQDCANSITTSAQKIDLIQNDPACAEKKHLLVEKLQCEIAMQEFLLAAESKPLEQIEQELARILATAEAQGVIMLINKDAITSIQEKIKHLRNAFPK